LVPPRSSADRDGRLSDKPSALFRWVAAASAFVFAFAPVVSAAQSVPAGSTQIVPDGRTATTVTNSGGVTNITTNTIAGQNAFNSFSHFKTGSGTTVNLQVPSSAGNLVNLVHDSPVVIDGILNSYKDGKIGGNVYFADPHGFIVGKSGVVNVGALTVGTPTKQFMDSLISPSGQIGAAATQQLIDGTFPLSPNGTISVRGRINANDGVRLIGQTVGVGPGHEKRNANIAQAAKFAATVNSKGLRNSSGIVVRNGSIQIVAGGNARINGRLSARSRGNPSSVTVTAGKNVTIGDRAKLTANSRSGAAGSISVKAVNDISIAKGATLSARSKAGKGGDIIVFADGNLNVASGASVDVSSKASDAGFVELSAKNAVTIGVLKLDLTAPNGKAGTLLIDPTDLVIDGGSNSTTSTTIVSNGGNVVLTASNSITITSTGVIDTRVFDRNANGGVLGVLNPSTATSGSISLTAPNIVVNGKLLAEVSAGSAFAAGNITLTANASTNITSGLATTTAGIAISGEVRGRDIVMTSDATAISSLTDSILGFVQLGAQTLLASQIGLNGGYVATELSSTVLIKNGANVAASGSLTLKSHGVNVASDPVVAAAAGAATVVIGIIDSTVSTQIQSGATVSTGSGLFLQSTADSTLAVSSLAVSGGLVPVGASIAYSKSNIQTDATIASGATIEARGSVFVRAHNDVSFSTSASAMALGASSVGIAVAYSDNTASAIANIGASLTSGMNQVGRVVVEGTTDATKNVTTTSVSVGAPGLVALIADQLNICCNLNSWASDKIGAGAMGSSVVVPKFGSAVTIANSDLSGIASIAATSGSAPVIRSSENVAVVSRVSDAAMRSLADASISSETTSPTNANAGASVALSAAINIGQFKHNSNAYIGAGTTITASNIGVSATTNIPITNTWLNWAGLSEVLSHINGNFGVVNNILTSYANASGDSNELSMTGSVNYFSLDNTTTAWVGHGATLTQTGNTTAWVTDDLLPRNRVLTGTQPSGQESMRVNWAAPVSVVASTTVESINVAGNLSILLVGAGSQGSSVGGSLTMFNSSSTTLAGIGDGVTVTSDNSVNVTATTQDTVIAVAPTSGLAKGLIALNGIASVLQIDNVTRASVSSTANITVPTLNVYADQGMSVTSLAGAFAAGGNNAVGISNAVLIVDTDTSAYVGANYVDISGSRNAANDPAHMQSPIGLIKSNAVNVEARTSGRSTVASVAAALSDPTNPPTTLTEKLKSAVKGPSSRPRSGAVWSGGIDTAKQASQDAAGQAPGGFSLDAAGASSISKLGLSTNASIAGTRIVAVDNTSTSAVSVLAVNNTINANGAGAAAMNLASNSSPMSTAISGAIATAIIENATTASITNTTISQARDVSVQALAAGEQTVVGIGMAVQASSANAASLSASVATVNDRVAAYMENSSVIGASSGTGRDVSVDAYQRTDIGIGAGSLYLGGKGGLGIALTYAEIRDPSGGAAVDAHLTKTSISQMDTLTVLAISSARIGSGAAAGGGGPDSNGIAGAIVVNKIDPTISAAINPGPVNTLNQSTITVTGDVTVRSDGTRISGFDAVLDGEVTRTNGGVSLSGTGSGIDFSASDLNSGGTPNTPGAAIIGVAGMVQAGKNNVGLALVVNMIAQKHLATVAHAAITSTSGDVYVIANDRTTILGVAVGLGIATGQFAGLASTVVNTINTQTFAQVGNSFVFPVASINARDIYVQAINNASIRGAAGTLGLGLGGAALGLSIVYDSIGGSVTSEINGAALVASRDISITSASNANILTVALGIAMASSVGIAGSVATSILKTDVTAQIRNSADVVANNNIALLASNTNTIQVIAGAAGVGVSSAGVGISVVVNEVGGSTTAAITGALTYVDAKGLGTGTLSVNSGTLNHNFDVSTASAPSINGPDLSEQQRTVHGLAVVATSHQAIDATSVTLGLSFQPFVGDALALTPVTNLMSGTTQAYVDGARIDTRLTVANTAGVPDVYVGASSQTLSRNLVIAAAGAGGLAGAGAASGTRLNRTTLAYMNNATVGTLVGGVPAAGNIVINAAANQASNNTVVGFAIGFGGGAASAIVNVFSADTEAYLTGGNIGGRSLTVNAKSSSGYFAATASGGIGIVGIAGAFIVGVSNNTTRAYIGRDTGGATNIALSNGLTVSADASNTFNSFAIGGALGGLAGVAGMADFTIVDNTTEAKFVNGTLTQTSGGASITANETIDITPSTGAGAVALSGAGIGAGANVVLIKSKVAATVLNGNLSLPGALTVSATSAKDIDMMTATLGAGNSFGVGAAVSVLLIGTNASGDAADQISGSASAANAISNGPAPGNGVRSSSTPGNNQQAANTPAPYSIASALGGAASSSVTAEITGGTTSAGSVGVSALSKAKTTNVATGVGVGGSTVGIGGSFAFTRLNDTVTASVTSATTAASLSVTAAVQDISLRAIDVQAYAGGAGLVLGIGAAVADGRSDNVVTAQIGGTFTGDRTGTVTVDAEDTSRVNTRAVGATAGVGGAVGASTAISEKDSNVTARVSPNSTVTDYTQADVTAENSGAVTAESIAGAAGAGVAAAGSGATATDGSDVTARVGHDSTFTLGNGGLNVTATATPNAVSNALGIAVSLNVGIGASVGLTNVSPTVVAAIEDDVRVNNSSGATSNVTVAAAVNQNGSNKSGQSGAIAGTGGALIGLNATVSTVNNTSNVSATIGDDFTSPSGAISVAATNQTSQSATTTGVSAGTYAAGFNMSTANADTTTTATVGNRASVNGTTLSITATGNDTNNAESVAGTGGIVAGNASYAATSSRSNTTATLGGSDATHRITLSGGLTVAAQHTTNFNGSSDSVNASLVGGSGAILTHAIDSTVSATIADNAYVRSRDLALTAKNITSHLFSNEGNPDAASWDLNSGSGGLLNLPAGKMQIDVWQTTTATIGNNVDIHLLSPSSGVNTLKVEAFNDITIHEKAKLDSGGAIAIADTQAFININRNNAAIQIGSSTAATPSGSIIMDTGDVKVGAWHDVDVDVRVASTTYGLAGAPSGKAEITYTGADTVNIGKNVRLEASNGAVTVAAGDSPDGTIAVIKASATLDLYNKTAIPIPIPPNPKVRINATADVFIDTSGASPNGIRSAGDMSIFADRGTITMSAVGTGKDIYREELARLASAVSNLFGGGDVTFDYHGGTTGQTGLATLKIDGTLQTGIQRTRYITLDYDANGNLIVDTNGVSYTLDPNASAGATLLFRLAELQNLLQVYATDPIARGAYASEIIFLKQKLVAMGLASGDPLGTTFNIGSWAQNIQSAYAQVQRDKVLLNGLASTGASQAEQLVTYGSTFVTGAGTFAGSSAAAVSDWGNSSTFNTVQWLISEIINNISNLSKYTANNVANSQTRTDITNLQASGNTKVGEVQTLATTYSGLSTNIVSQRDTLSGLQTSIATNGNTATTAGLPQSEIDTAYAAISGLLGTLNGTSTSYSNSVGGVLSNASSLGTKIGELNSLMSQLKTKLNDLAGLARDGGSTSDTNIYNGAIVPKLDYLQTLIDANTSRASTANSFASTNNVAMYVAVTTKPAEIANNTFMYNSNYTPYASHSQALADATTGLSGGAVVVGNIEAKLGNLNLRADSLIGSGALRAPGDAQINVTNKTANILKVNNLTINSDSGGRLRYNGVLVDSLADINALNLKGGTGAFGVVETARTQAAVGRVPSINISSEYDPTLPSPGGAHPAPDIQLSSGSRISNPLGSVTILSKAGNIYSNGTIDANTVTINVKNGDFVQSFVFGYNHVAGDPAGTGLAGGDPTQNAAGGGIVANGAVFISARYLNINGLIQSGIDQWTLTLAADPTLVASAQLLNVDLTTAIGTYNNQVGAHTRVAIATSHGTVYYNGVLGQVEFDTTYANADHGSGSSQIANALYKIKASSGSNIDAYYDAANNTYQADATKVLGGYVQLYGQILNTSPGGTDSNGNTLGGRIRVLDGFGQITINNPTSRTLVLNTLDTGLDPSSTGRGIAGIIDITNVSVDQATNAVSAVRTVYTRNSALNQINVATTTGTLSATGTVVGTTVLSSASGRSTSYTLQDGLRYVYTTGTDSSTITYLETVGTELFGSSTLTIDSSVHWDHTDGPYMLGTYRIATGTYTRIDTANNASAIVTDTTARTTNQVYVKTAEWTDCNWWTLCTVSDRHTQVTRTDYITSITTNSLKANYPIAIQFGGADSGSIAVNSNAPVVIKGAMNNRNGTTTVSASDISVGPNLPPGTSTLVSSKGINLTATNGSVGSSSAPIQVDITNGGSLSASAANGNVNIAALHDFRFGTVVASGDTTQGRGRVALSAQGDILASNSSTSYVEGARIELSAPNGSIGTMSNPLKVHVGNTDTTGGFTPAGYYGFKASAATDINVEATTWSGNTVGDFLLDMVTSLGGDVRLTAPGRIIDNNPIQSIDTRTYNQLLAYWTSLGLVDGSQNNDDRKVAATATFEAGRVADYKQYWQFRKGQADGGVIYDPNFAYVATAAEKTMLAQQFASLDPTLTQTQITAKIADYEASRTAQYKALHTLVGSYTAGYEANFTIATASQTVRDAVQAEETKLLNGSSWTERELAFSLSPGALKTITGTNPVIKLANVSGREVTLVAGKGLGQSLAQIVIDTSTINSPTDLTDQQKIALVTAERSDFVDNANPNLIVISPKQPLNFAAVTGLNVSVTAPVVVGQPDVGAVYLASTGDALLRNIDVSGEARFKVRGSIVNASGSPASSIVTGNLILEAANGAVGLIQNLTTGEYDHQTLRLALRSGSTVTVRAAEGIDLNATNGDMNVDTIYSPNDIKLVSQNSIVNAIGDQLINILGSNVTLTVLNGTIGAAGTALNVGTNLNGGIVADALGLINLFGPRAYEFTVKHLQTADRILVTAAGNGTIDGDVTSANQIEFNSAAALRFTGNANVTSTTSSIEINTSLPTPLLPASSVVMASGAQFHAQTHITVLTGGNATLTGLTAVGEVYADVGGQLTIETTGSITSQTDKVRVEAASLAMGQGSSIVAADRVSITTDGDAMLGALISQLDPGPNGAPTITVSAGTPSTAGAILGNGDGQINLKTVRPNASVVLTATNGIGVEARPIKVDVPILTATTVEGGIYIDALGNIKVPLLSAPQGETSINATGDLSIDKVKGAIVKFNSGGDLYIGLIEATKAVQIAANTITTNIVQPPGSPSPLFISFTGPGGGIAKSVRANIDAPNGTTFSQLFATDAFISTNGQNVQIVKGNVPGQLELVTPTQDIVLNNRNSGPMVGPTLQMYGPGQLFSLSQNGNFVATSNYVVAYGTNSAVIGLDVYAGISFIRDFVRDMQNGEMLELMEVTKDGKTFYVLGLSPLARLDAFALPAPVENIGSGPAVNIEGLQ